MKPTASQCVCLITPGHIASTPRLVKEADALAGAGYRVHVVAGRSFAPIDPLDDEIFAASPWERTQVDFRHGPSVTLRKVLHRAARLVLSRRPFASIRIIARAQHAESLRFARVAARIPAALYIGHCLAGLSAAALAARARGVKYGFDAEDLHDAETESAIARPAIRTAARELQSRLLPDCVHLTASSPLIGAELQRRYAVVPTTVLNVFPLTHAPAHPFDPGPVSADRPAIFYWFSQTIGPGRGLERVLAILGCMRTPVRLQLRGFPALDYIPHLQSLAARHKLRPIELLPLGAPSEMARLASTADLGLATEESRPLNHDLCLANKIFVYLLAGIPQLLSPTSAQTALAMELGESALLSEPDNPGATARRLDDLLADPAKLARARAAAWRLARERFNWDLEQQGFLNSVKTAFTVPSADAARSPA